MRSSILGIIAALAVSLAANAAQANGHGGGNGGGHNGGNGGGHNGGGSGYGHHHNGGVIVIGGFNPYVSPYPYGYGVQPRWVWNGYRWVRAY